MWVVDEVSEIKTLGFESGWQLAICGEVDVTVDMYSTNRYRDCVSGDTSVT